MVDGVDDGRSDCRDLPCEARARPAVAGQDRVQCVARRWRVRMCVATMTAHHKENTVSEVEQLGKLGGLHRSGECRRACARRRQRARAQPRRPMDRQRVQRHRPRDGHGDVVPTRGVHRARAVRRQRSPDLRAALVLRAACRRFGREPDGVPGVVNRPLRGLSSRRISRTTQRVPQLFDGRSPWASLREFSGRCIPSRRGWNDRRTPTRL